MTTPEPSLRMSLTLNLLLFKLTPDPCRMTDKGIFTVAKLCKRLQTANITNCSFTKKMTSYLKVKRGLRWIFNFDAFLKTKQLQTQEHPVQPSPQEGFRDTRQEIFSLLNNLNNAWSMMNTPDPQGWLLRRQSVRPCRWARLSNWLTIITNSYRHRSLSLPFKLVERSNISFRC